MDLPLPVHHVSMNLHIHDKRSGYPALLPNNHLRGSLHWVSGSKLLFVDIRVFDGSEL
jgi:hypothetical protein